MSRIVTNSDDGYCTVCGTVGEIELVPGTSNVICSVCKSPNLAARETGTMFVPMFGVNPEKTFQVNKYGPVLPCRRKARTQYPKIRDRRIQR
jgi:hypothetical protein